MTPKILILGAGYGGLTTALRLQKELHYNEADITLVNKHDYHYITTHLHQPAAGTVDPRRIKIDLDELIDKDRINFIKAEVVAIDIQNERKVTLDNGQGLTYDILVIALGSEVETFGIEGLKEHAFTIRSINSVQLIREHIEYMFAKYKNEPGHPEYLTFIVGGAGFTGIEFVGELADRIPELCEQFEVNPKKVRIINIEAAPSALPGFDPQLVDYAIEVLKNKGVEFKINTPIKACTEEGVTLADGEEIKAGTVVWTGGVRGNKLIEMLGIETMRARIKVDEFLRAPGYQDVFIIGDNSIVFNEEGRPYPPTAQIAVQQGEHLAKQITSYVRNGKMDLKPFKFNLRGTVASLGKGEAIGKVGNRKMTGYTALIMKQLIDNRYLYSIGGLPLVIKKGKLLG
ncbi:NAD(P)/FAD-dependent oxidoreductase [Tepidibacillus decaturensis]|uniref:NADH dehydrogenase n=1 Tax=Tepidibacillus decaturensis TaxID=1413211 RepID=A0A135L5E9_9BACI|nr:NAD(P)/FAD-dependent oxidoreductase [Tepidibacillus decaturensis]KXG44159.1 NADH dehydrogenase [Tepidibacillus decaturensis]